MPGHPLKYDSLKAVLLYMEANQRFQISLRVPSLRIVEKIVPLRIDNYQLVDYRAIINNTHYRLGVYRRYHSGNPPRLVQEVNDNGGASHDFDEFGFPVSSGMNVLLPGDVSFQGEHPDPDREDTEEMEMSYRRALQIHKGALEKLTELKSKGITVEEYLNSLPPIPLNERFGVENSIRKALNLSCDLLRRLIDDDQVNLLPFECRRNNTKPPFTYYVQLRITKKMKEIQRFEYTKKLFEADKQLNQVLFGGRKTPVLVGNLQMNTISTKFVLRMPQGFRFRANFFSASDSTIVHRNFPRFVEDSENLDTVWIHSCYRQITPTANSRAMKARKLVISAIRVDLDAMRLIVRNLPNQQICINSFRVIYSAQEISELVPLWLSGPRQIGSKFCMGLAEDATGREVLKLVRTRYNNAKRTKRCVTAPLNNLSKLEVFYVPFEKSNKEFRGVNMKWMLKFRIVHA